eukprot:9486000-Pyramimonas_sp.AAC.1
MQAFNDGTIDNSYYIDFSIKTVSTFKGSLEVAGATGRCPMDLYVYMLFVRRELFSNTQAVEGTNSTLQRVTELAPNCRLATASDVIQIKKGDAIDVHECVCLDPHITTYQKSAEYIHRFREYTTDDIATVPHESPAPRIAL